MVINWKEPIDDLAKEIAKSWTEDDKRMGLCDPYESDAWEDNLVCAKAFIERIRAIKED